MKTFPINFESEERFGAELKKVISPSNPLVQPGSLKGRAEQLKDIQRAMVQDGRHVFIFGHKGVGKTSLGKTAGRVLQHERDNEQVEPIYLVCDPQTTFAHAIKQLVVAGIQQPRTLKASIQGRDRKMSFSTKAFNAEAKVTAQEQYGPVENPENVNDAVEMLKSLIGRHSNKPIVIIDEFDQITSKEEKGRFAHLIKQISDHNLPIGMIFCGTGENIDDLMAGHNSVHRYLFPVNLERLRLDPRKQIIQSAADVLGVAIDQDTILRICRISDGFPHYVHLICEKLFWKVFDKKNGGQVTYLLFEAALMSASDAIEAELKAPYDRATKKYSGDYEHVLFAAADAHEFQRRSQQIYASYQRICGDMGIEPLERGKFSARLNRLKRPEHDRILVANRQGWYEFREKILRGYVRLKAAQQSIDLEVDLAGQPTKFSYKG